MERDWGGSAKAVAFELSLACLEDQNDLNRQRCAVCLCMCVRVHACARARVHVCVWMVQVAMREMGEDEGNGPGASKKWLDVEGAVRAEAQTGEAPRVPSEPGAKRADYSWERGPAGGGTRGPERDLYPNLPSCEVELS